MARATRSVRTGPGYPALIFFIVLCLALIGGYVWLVPQYAKRGTSLNQLHRDIKENLEDKLKPLGVSAAMRATTSDVAYDRQFFTKVGNAATDGLKYADLVTLSGFTGDNPIEQIKDALSKSTPPSENLRAYIERLNTTITDLQARLNNANNDLRTAVAARDEALQLAREESNRLKQAREQAAKDLAEARKAYNADITRFSEMAAKAEENAKKAWAENATLAEAHKKQVAELRATIQKLEMDLRTAKEELERKKPRQVAVTEGRVLQADLTEGIVIINLGKRDNIQNGEKFTVMRVGKGGERIPKGELQLVRVDENVSRADIIKQDLKDPIMRDDIVLRQKKTEETL